MDEIPDDVSVEDIKTLFERASIVFEYQSSRHSNLELLGIYGTNSWKYASTQLQMIFEKVETLCKSNAQIVGDICRERKVEQVCAHKFK
jgi:hypothetical protein